LKQEQVYLQTIESKQSEIDSLDMEIYSKEIIIGRYEITFDYLKDRNPEVAKEINEFFNEETE
jgi:hypothetical protein